MNRAHFPNAGRVLLVAGSLLVLAVAAAVIGLAVIAGSPDPYAEPYS
jgi:hypothetical protein